MDDPCTGMPEMKTRKRRPGRRRWGENLFIGASPYVSGLCYSIFRVEPYAGCPMGCVYCYTRWYPSRGGSQQVWDFERAASEVYSAGLVPVPFRLSTLTEPFQPLEEERKLSLKVLKVALRTRYPLIVNTRSALISRDPWRALLQQLGEEGLVVLQVSVSTLSEKHRVLEPKTPSPRDLLSAASKLVERGVPLVVRYEPLIPGLSDVESEAERAFEAFAEAGAEHVIVEFLRIERDKLGFFENIALDTVPYSLRWETYSIEKEEGPVKPPLDYRRGKARMLRDLATKKGLTFATCKEGFFDLHTSPECCGVYLLGVRHLLRPTLAEVYRMVRERGSMNAQRVINELKRMPGWVAGSRVDAYPRPLRKGLRWHENVLASMLRSGQAARVTPLLKFEDGVISLSL